MRVMISFVFIHWVCDSIYTSGYLLVLLIFTLDVLLVPGENILWQERNWQGDIGDELTTAEPRLHLLGVGTNNEANNSHLTNSPDNTQLNTKLLFIRPANYELKITCIIIIVPTFLSLIVICLFPPAIMCPQYVMLQYLLKHHAIV